MPLFEGHKAKGIQRLFIEMPDDEKMQIAWKWPDQQIIQHSQLNVDLDYQAVFTNLGKVIGVMGPGRWPLDEGASLTLGWLVDRLTGDAYYDAEVYFVTTRDLAGQEFGGPVDNLTDGPSGLVVSVRVYGELAFHVIDPAVLLAKLIGTDGVEDFNGEISGWVVEQAMAAIRVVLPDLVADHGVLAMGQLQEATGDAALAKANVKLAPYGLAVTTFAELNVNLPDADAQQIKQLAAAKAYTSVAGSFDSGVRGEATLNIAQGVASGNVGAQPAVVAGMMMGMPIAPGTAGAPVPVPAAPAGSPAAPAAAPAGAGVPGEAHFCTQCGTAIPTGARFCPNCGAAVAPAATAGGTPVGEPPAPTEGAPGA
jgi:membrane protease subunit (stomatin/prohibitin family)